LEDNKAIVRAYVETVWNRRQLQRADDVVAPDFVDHAPLPGQAPGLDGAKRKWAMYLDAIPDLRVTIEELMAEGDKVAGTPHLRGHAQGRAVGHTGHWQQLRVGGISIFRLAEGRIAEHWEQLDRLALMQQLGVVPAPVTRKAPTG
jgi:predicted ester cyclase